MRSREFGGAPRAGHILFGHTEAEKFASRSGRHSVHLQLSGDIPARLGIQNFKRYVVALSDAQIADPWQQCGPLSARGVLVVCLREAGPC